MNVYKKSDKITAFIICLFIVMQLIFRSFYLEVWAVAGDITVGMIFKDNTGYHIVNATGSIDSFGRLILQSPNNLGAVNNLNEIYSGWAPVLVGNSFENVERVITNGGTLTVQDYDISNPPTLATPSMATSSIATSSQATSSNSFFNSGFTPLNDEASRNAVFTLYRSNTVYTIGAGIQILDPDNSGTVSPDMSQFLSMNGNRKQIFFLALSEPVNNIPDNPIIPLPQNIPETSVSESIPESITQIESIPESTAQIESIPETNTQPESVTTQTSENTIINDSFSHNNDGNSDDIIQKPVVKEMTSANIVESNEASKESTAIPENKEPENKAALQNIVEPKGRGESTDTVSKKTNKEVSIERDIINNKNNGFLNTRSTSYTVIDENFDAGNYSVSVYKIIDGKEVLVNAGYSWYSSKDRHIVTILLNNDGEYRISVVKKDVSGAAGSSLKGVIFEEKVKVDTTAPYITVSGVENLTANARTVSPVIRYSDQNIDLLKSTITLTSVTNGRVKELLYKAVKDGSGYILNLDPINIDDNYILTIRIYDMAGNVTEEKVNFSVNKNGATFKFKPEEIVGKYTNKPFYPVIEVWNTDEISVVSVTINGMDEPYEFTEGELRFLNPINKDGKYIFNLEVADTAGNHSTMKPVELIFDATKPVTFISGVKEGESYVGSVKIIISTQLPGDIIDLIRLNGTLLTENNYKTRGDGSVELIITEPGAKSLQVQSRDSAGNISDMVLVNFDMRPSNKASGYIPMAVISLAFAGAISAYRYNRKKEEQ